MSTVAGLPGAGQLAERLGGGGHAVADPAALDHGMVGAALQNLAASAKRSSVRILRGGPDAFHARRALARKAWQIASASASAAWSDSGGSGRDEQRADHALDLVLARRAAPAHGELHRLRRIGEARDVAPARAREHGAARLPDGERAAHVAAEVDLLDRERVRARARRAARRCCAAIAARRCSSGSPAGGRDHAAADGAEALRRATRLCRSRWRRCRGQSPAP